MTTVHHIARAVGRTGTDGPQYRVVLHTGRHDLVGDEPEENGGADEGPSPFGLLLSGLVACTAITLRMFAERHGWVPITLDVDVRYDISDDDTKVIRRTITVPAGTPDEQVRRLEDISARTPVTLAIGIPIETTVRTAD